MHVQCLNYVTRLCHTSTSSMLSRTACFVRNYILQAFHMPALAWDSGYSISVWTWETYPIGLLLLYCAWLCRLLRVPSAAWSVHTLKYYNEALRYRIPTRLCMQQYVTYHCIILLVTFISIIPTLEAVYAQTMLLLVVVMLKGAEHYLEHNCKGLSPSLTRNLFRSIDTCTCMLAHTNTCSYHMAGNFAGEFILVDWRFWEQSASISICQNFYSMS